MTDAVIGKVCTIVLNWNGWSDTCECLDSLLTSERMPDMIVVVDNGSTDNSVERLITWGNSHFDSVVCISETDGEFDARAHTQIAPFVLVKNRKNLGYAAGNNRAIAWALQQDVFEYIWLLNNDTVVEKDSLAKLLMCADTSRAAVFGSTMVYADRPDIVQCAGGCRYNSVTTIFKASLQDLPLTQTLDVDEPAIDYIYGASLFVRTKVFEECGLLNEAYFLFYEEIDFCMRAKQKGFALHWCRESVVAHKVSQSVGQPETSSKEKLIVANYHENLSTLIFSWRFCKHIFPFIFCFRFFGKFAILSTRKEWYLIKPLLLAYRDFCFAGRGSKVKSP